MNLLPAVLSFLLPGLGQVFQRRILPALVAFSLFTSLHFFSWGRWLMPVAALAASLDCFLREKRTASPSAPRVRTAIFVTTGMIGFLGWMLLSSPVFLPIGGLLDTQFQAEKIARDVRECREALGQNLIHPAQCPRFSKGLPLDRWGELFHYRRMEAGFEVRSSGPDRRAGTGDDFVFRYRD